jgi:hypothetical protein
MTQHHWSNLSGILNWNQLDALGRAMASSLRQLGPLVTPRRGFQRLSGIRSTECNDAVHF